MAVSGPGSGFLTACDVDQLLVENPELGMRMKVRASPFSPSRVDRRDLHSPATVMDCYSKFGTPGAAVGIRECREAARAERQQLRRRSLGPPGALTRP